MSVEGMETYTNDQLIEEPAMTPTLLGVGSSTARSSLLQICSLRSAKP